MSRSASTFLLTLFLLYCGNFVCAHGTLETLLSQPAQPNLYRVDREKPFTYAQVPLARLLAAAVVKVADGDTITVEAANGVGRGIRLWPESFEARERIRLLGVDAPELPKGKERGEPGANEAKRFAERALLGKTVYLAFDHDLRDRYGRLLCYVYLEDGSLFNARLIEEGWSPAYVRYRFAFSAPSASWKSRRARGGRGCGGFEILLLERTTRNPLVITLLNSKSIFNRRFSHRILWYTSFSNYHLQGGLKGIGKARAGAQIAPGGFQQSHQIA